MAAPNTVYLFSGNTSLPVHIEGEIKLDSYPALLLADYGTKIKDLFYLDAFIMVDDEKGNQGVLGMIKDTPGSVNYKMHNQNKWFKPRLAPENDNQEYIVLNDAGLNTLPFAEMPFVKFRDNQVGEINIISQVFRSSYYSNTTSYGFYVNSNKNNQREGDYTKITVGNHINANTALSQAFNVPSRLINVNDYVFIKAFIANEEGEYVSEAAVLFADQLREIKGTTALWPSQACSGGKQESFYAAKWPVLPGDLLYRENDPEFPINGQIAISSGGKYYFISQQSNLVYAVTSVGNCGGPYPYNDPANINYRTLTFNYSSPDKMDGCVFLLYEGGNSLRTIYQNNVNGKYYKDTASARNGGTTGYVDNEYYFRRYAPKDVTWIQIVNGEQIASGSC